MVLVIGLKKTFYVRHKRSLPTDLGSVQQISENRAHLWLDYCFKAYLNR